MNNSEPTLRLCYICTTFPRLSETFLQREIRVLRKKPISLAIYSIFGGESQFEGQPIRSFALWKLITLLGWIPYWMIRKPRVLHEILNDALYRDFPCFLNWAENFLGFGFALCKAREIERLDANLLHAVWATAPASAALLLKRLLGIPFSMGAHAYDLFKKGGDRFLLEKIAETKLIHTSTQFGKNYLIQLGAEPGKIHLIRRGLNNIPGLDNNWLPHCPIRLLSVGRLVPKKGFFFQLEIAEQLYQNDVPFVLKIIGEGPLKDELIKSIRNKPWKNQILFSGALSNEAVLQSIRESDVYLFTGRVDEDGDRDGLPNVVAEAMAFSKPIITSPVEGVLEAVEHGTTGVVLPLDKPEIWRDQIVEMISQPATVKSLIEGAYQWVVGNFRAESNTEELFQLLKKAKK